MCDIGIYRVLGVSLQIVQKAFLGVLEWGTELTLSGEEKLSQICKRS